MSFQTELDEYTARRRELVRRARMYQYGSLAAAFVVAVGGTALIALLLRSTGLPFLRTWLVLSIVVLVPAGLGFAWRALRGS